MGLYSSVVERLREGHGLPVVLRAGRPLAVVGSSSLSGLITISNPSPPPNHGGNDR